MQILVHGPAHRLTNDLYQSEFLHIGYSLERVLVQTKQVCAMRNRDAELRIAAAPMIIDVIRFVFYQHVVGRLLRSQAMRDHDNIGCTLSPHDIVLGGTRFSDYTWIYNR